MSKHNNSYTFFFAAAVCVVCSLSLAFVAQALRERQLLNVELDIKKNILKAVSLEQKLAPKATADEILGAYEQKIQEIVVSSDGQVLEGKTHSDFDFAVDASVLPMYVYQENGRVKSYCYPISGKGLWSTLYGYLAIEPDGSTVRGITFYKHGETPGLGAEIEKPWFQDNFQGKSIWSDAKNEIQPVAVVKGQVSTVVPGPESVHYVDGISGATITSNGVTDLLDVAIRKYEPYFQSIRS